MSVNAFVIYPTTTLSFSVLHAKTKARSKSKTKTVEIEFDLEEPIMELNVQDPEQVLPECKASMQKTITSFQKSLCTIVVGRASPDLLTKITVRAYGMPTPISQLATISTVGMQSLTVEPYDTNLMKSMVKSIVDGDLGLNPTNDGSMIYINVPPLSEELRLTMAKKCKRMAEDGKVAVRNIRRGGMDAIKKCEKEGTISQDMLKGMEKDIQKVTEDFIQKVEDLAQKKEAEVMTI